MKLSRFFKVPIDHILGGDFTKWDIIEKNVPYPSVDEASLAKSDISVSEANRTYDIASDDLRDAQAYLSRVEFEGLTQGEVDLLAEYALFIKSRRKVEQ